MNHWEKRYQMGDTPWEKGRPAPPLLELFEKKGVEIFGAGEVIVPGCGTGHDVRALAQVGVAAVGLDIAESAVKLAQEYPVAGLERYEVGDFLDAQWRSGRVYRGMWEHTCFCAIDPAMRASYAVAAAELIEAGGFLAGVFFLNPHDSGEVAVGPPHGATADEIQEYFQPWFECEDAWVPERGYAGRLGREWIGLFRRLSNPSVERETRAF